MALMDHVKCGRVIVFSSMLLRRRVAFCIDVDRNNQIVYRGLFGLRCVDRETFFSFAKIMDVYDYIDRPLRNEETIKMRALFVRNKLISKHKNVMALVEELYRLTGIILFINQEVLPK